MLKVAEESAPPKIILPPPEMLSVKLLFENVALVKVPAVPSALRIFNRRADKPYPFSVDVLFRPHVS